MTRRRQGGRRPSWRKCAAEPSGRRPPAVSDSLIGHPGLDARARGTLSAASRFGMAQHDPFGAFATFESGGRSHRFFRLAALSEHGLGDVDSLPTRSRSCSRACSGTATTSSTRRTTSSRWRCTTPRVKEHGDPLHARTGGAAGLHRRADRGRPRRLAFGGGADGRRRGRREPLVRADLGHRPLGAGRRLRNRQGDAAQYRAEFQRNRERTSSSSGARRRSATSRSCRRRPASCTR